jgi:hypothetical protein
MEAVPTTAEMPKANFLEAEIWSRFEWTPVTGRLWAVPETALQEPLQGVDVWRPEPKVKIIPINQVVVWNWSEPCRVRHWRVTSASWALSGRNRTHSQGSYGSLFRWGACPSLGCKACKALKLLNCRGSGIGCYAKIYPQGECLLVGPIPAFMTRCR